MTTSRVVTKTYTLCKHYSQYYVQLIADLNSVSERPSKNLIEVQLKVNDNPFVKI